MCPTARRSAGGRPLSQRTPAAHSAYTYTRQQKHFKTPAFAESPRKRDGVTVQAEVRGRQEVALLKRGFLRSMICRSRRGAAIAPKIDETHTPFLSRVGDGLEPSASRLGGERRQNPWIIAISDVDRAAQQANARDETSVNE